MNDKKAFSRHILLMAVYYICLLAVWGVYSIYLSPAIKNALGEDTLASSLLRNGLIKNLVWTLPAAFLIVKFRERCLVSLKDMFTKMAPGWKSCLVFFPVFIVYLLISAFKTHGGIQISESFGIDDIITVLFVGLTEEIVFRGWLLGSSVKENSSPKATYTAIGVNAVMFLCIHFPRWISEGEFVSSFTSFGFVSILILSCIFSYVFIKTRNLILPIALHMLWDLLVFMLI